jgi:hypothetical protein
MGTGLEFFSTATSSSISRAIAELKLTVGSKPLSNEVHMAFVSTSMLSSIIIPKGKDRLPPHGPLLECSSPNNVPSPRAVRDASF